MVNVCHGNVYSCYSHTDCPATKCTAIDSYSTVVVADKAMNSAWPLGAY